MPPLKVERIETVDGVVFIHWHDEENLDGDPLDAVFELHEGTVEELLHARALVQAPTDKFQALLDELPAQVSNPPILTWRAAYEEHLRDCIDRVRLDIRPDAPHEILEDARQGVEIPKQYKKPLSSRPPGVPHEPLGT